MRLRNDPTDTSFVLIIILIILLVIVIGLVRSKAQDLPDRSSTPTKEGRKHLGGPVTCCVTGEYTRRKKARQRARRKARRKYWLNIYKKQMRDQYNSLFPQQSQRGW